MNRFTDTFGLRIDRTDLLVLAFAFLTVPILGCVPGSISTMPLSTKLQTPLTHCSGVENSFSKMVTTNARLRRMMRCLKTHLSLYGGTKPFTSGQSAIVLSVNSRPLLKDSKCIRIL